MQLKRAGFLAIALGLILSTQAPALALASPTGSQPAVTASAPAYTRVLKRGCKGSDVKTLQTRLKELNFYSGAADGIFGGGTENAVKAFQKANSLSVDGVAGRNTHTALYRDASGGTGGTGGSGTGGGSQPSSSAPAYTRVLKRGCKGSDVKTLQTRLKGLSFYSGVADGIFGGGTENAVKAFQKANSLSVDGVVGRNTHTALYRDGAPGGGTGGTGGSGGTGGDTGGGTPTYTLGKLNNQITLKKGSTGANVKDLQTALTIKGFFSGKIDGVFGNSTVTAVKSFQRSVKLDVDGLAGNYTLSALYTMLNPPDLSSVTPWPRTIDASLALPVEKLTWDAVSGSVFARNLSAVIVDVRTGYTFNIKRTGGTKHADVETITPTDTATLFKACGNFSWDRRPVWVFVNGRRLAASMNCMPHGYDTLANNDMKGQFCIHFIGSRTHGSNKVDPDHQACIEEAYEAGLTITANPDATPAPDPSASPVG